MKICSYCGKENEDGMVQCAGCATALPEQASPTPLPNTTTCPHCRKSEGFEDSVPIKRSFSWLVFFLGGFTFAAIHAASRKSRAKCKACGDFFYVRTGGSKVFLIILITLVLLALLGLIEAFLG